MFFLRDLPTRQMLDGYREQFPEMDVAAVESALGLLRRASLLLRQLDAHFAAHDASQLRFLILVVIDREPDRQALSFGDITERLDVSKPVMTRALGALAADGLVTMAAHSADRRTMLVRLTAEGRAKLHAILPGYYRIIQAFMQGYGDQTNAAGGTESDTD